MVSRSWMARHSPFERSLATSVFPVIISTVFLIAAGIRLWTLRREPVKVRPSWLYHVKLVVSQILPLILLGRLMASVLQEPAGTLQNISVYLALGSGVAVAWISTREHKASIKPSSLAVIYLLATAACNLITLTYTKHSIAYFRETWTGTFVVLELSTRLFLLCLESRSKRDILLSRYSDVSPEETAGILSRVSFWWLNGLLLLGNKRILRSTDIPQLDKRLSPNIMRSVILHHWDIREKPETSVALPKVLVRCLATPFLSIIFPRLLLVVLRCSQPIIIDWAIEFVSSARLEDQQEEDESTEGYWLLLATSTVYIGLAIVTSIYNNRLNRLRIMLRGSVVSLIYNKALTMSSGSSDIGKAMTLMSTDVDGIAGTAGMFHETWGKFIELTIGVILLARQVHWLWPLPLVFIALCSRVSRYVAHNIRSRQKGWNMATQKRISALSSVLGSMKSVKAVGLAEYMIDYISNLRENEIDSSKRVRWVNVAYNASANALSIFTPVITVELFAIIANLHGSSLDARTAFSTIAILAIVTHPANMIMTIVPEAVAAFASFDRIQSYLLETSLSDMRRLGDQATVSLLDSPSGNDISAALHIHGATVTVPGRSEPIIHDINLTLALGSVTICSGPVGSGKSTLAKLILGEISPSIGELTVPSKRVGFADQSAWLPTGSLRDIICAFNSQMDHERFDSVVRACCLNYDIERLPEGSDTRIGSRGINLSGGQKQRVALARLLYARHDISVLDDPFNALDGDTENKILDNLLGPGGWFRKEMQTVFLVTNSAQHFHLADHILLLGDGTIQEQGSWEEMKSFSTKLEKFTFGATTAAKSTSTDDSLMLRVDAQKDTDAEEDLYRQTGDISLYKFYLKSAGVFNMLLLVVCNSTYSFLVTFPFYWIKLWTESEKGIGEMGHSVYYMAGYALFAFTSWVATNGTMWTTVILLAPRSGRLLHQSLLTTIFGAPLSFFSTTDIGVTLNRFSQDIGLVDRQLPSALSALCVQVFKMATQISVLFAVQRQLVISLPVCIVVVYFIQKSYLRTSRQLRVLELESQSVLYSWFLETADGVATIRAFQWQSDAEARNTANLDYSLRPLYVLMCLQRWLNLVLDLIVAGIAVGLVGIAVNWRDSTSEGDMGAGLNLILVANTTLVRLVESWTSLEISLGAIARLKSVEDHTPQEDQPGEDMMPGSTWPVKGEMSIADLTAGYSDAHMILHNVNLYIQEGQKLAICGRTGSGKSTAILALLRLIESSGTVTVNGIDLSRIPRSIVRGRCFITVPQDPLLLPDATVRFNLDPTSLAPDDVLQTALLKVGIWDQLTAATNITAREVLEQPLASLSTLSVGQRQLFAMARAVVQKYCIAASATYSDLDQNPNPKPVLLLDEATSSLDAVTESTIYDIIDSEFVTLGHTVIIVAHRLGALAGRMRSGTDSVAWFQDGMLVKVGDYDDMAKLVSLSQTSGDE